MSDTLNKDDINNNLEGDDIQKPLQNGNLSEKNGLEPKETENIKLNFQNNEPQPDATISNPDLPKSEYNSEPHDTEKTDVKNENTEKITTDEIQDSGTFDSKYQVNLIDERVLRVRTTTNQSVSIDCNVTVKEEFQSNKIYIPPKAEDLKQEIEVLVKIGSEEPATYADSETGDLKTEIRKKESNYQINLISENVLRIKISTNKSISVDSFLLDKTNIEDGEETQSNKIFIHPRQGITKQDVEVFIKIGDDADKPDNNLNIKKTEKAVQFKTPGLTPNPLVVDILSRLTKPAAKPPEESLNGLSDEEKLELKIGRKNPWKKNKEFLRKNLQRGFAAANTITIIAAILFYAFGAGKLKEDEEVVQKRLIVMQDLPENLNQLAQNVDDPNKPEEPKTDSETGSDVTPPKITPKRITPPRVNLPKLDKTLSDNDTTLNNELDSLRKVNDTSRNKNGIVDTTMMNASLMPDSLLKNLSENEVGLIGRFPPNWKQIDARDLNQISLFTGVILVDTTVKKEETLTMNIEIDSKGDRFGQFQFTKVFNEDTLTKTTIYSIDPKTEGKLTYYRFYVSTKTDNIFVNTFTVQPSFEKYKGEIERVVKSIRVKRPEPKTDN